MYGPDHLWVGRTLVCMWILSQLCTVSETRRYDKCFTRDGREGVCVLKRYCREASNHPLAPCERDSENHCCPIPTTQRSAVSMPLKPDWPREGDRHSPDPDKTDRRPVIPREPDRDDRRPVVSREPDRDDRRPVVSRDPDRDDRRPVVPRDPDRDDRRPVVSRDPDRDDRRPVVSRDPDRDDRRPVVPREPDRDDRLNKTPPPGDRRSPNRHSSGRPKKPPNIDVIDEYDNGRGRPNQPQNASPGRNRDVSQDRQPSRTTHPPVRYPDADHHYTAKDEQEPPRRVRPQKNRTDESSKAPIRFHETSKVPSPKVPACGVKPYELFIAGGEESDEHEWPWMTAIFRRHSDSRPKTFLCGGSLINTKYVLTAAHCFVNNYVILPASSFVVRLGSHLLDSGEEYTVANLVVHHNHSGSDFFNDIALVRLASEVYITDKIAPICLPEPAMLRDNLVGRLATVAGWGDTSFRTASTRMLQHVTVPVVSGEECFAAYSRVRGAAFLARGSDHVICAGLREGGKDACLGDSGGPLMMKMSDDRWIVVGIVSLGYKCAEPGYPGVYTRVTHYMHWINTNMKRH